MTTGKLRLFELADSLRGLGDHLEDLGLDPQTIRDTLDGESAEFEEKALAVAAVIRNLDAFAQAADIEAKRLSEKRDKARDRVRWLRDYLADQLAKVERKTIRGSVFSISVADGTPSVVLYAPEKIPREFWRQPETPAPEPDKAAIARALKDGLVIEGARLSHRSIVRIS